MLDAIYEDEAAKLLKTQNMRIVAWNLRGQTNWTYRRDLALLTNPDIICLNELWKTKDITGFKGYHVADQDTASRKINTSLYIKENIQHRRLSIGEEENLIVIAVGEPIHTYVACVYMRCGNGHDL